MNGNSELMVRRSREEPRARDFNITEVGFVSNYVVRAITDSLVSNDIEVKFDCKLTYIGARGTMSQTYENISTTRGEYIRVSNGVRTTLTYFEFTPNKNNHRSTSDKLKIRKRIDGQIVGEYSTTFTLLNWE